MVHIGEGFMAHAELPVLKEIELAADTVEGVACRTPLVESPPLSRITGHEVYLKLECCQPTKAFKIRGAFNKVSHLKEGKVVAASSGNHGIAVAYSARLLDKTCTIVVPEGAVKEKVKAIAGFGAEVVRAGRLSQEREAKAMKISHDTGAAFVHPFDDPRVISGQGTCGLEIQEQLEDIDSVLVPVGGGGLISGVSIALKAKSRAKVFGVEPKNAPKLTSALRAREPVTVSTTPSIADGLLPSALGVLPYEAVSRYVDGAFTVSEDEIFKATSTMINEAGFVAEPSGAASLAPLLSHSTEALGSRVVVIVSGGNISREILARVLAVPT